MKNSAFIAAALLSGLVGTSAFSQTETGSPAGKSGATFWVEHDVLSYTNNKLKPEEGADVETSGFQTTATDLTLRIFWNNFGLYVTPGSSGAEAPGKVGLSMFLQKEVELGVALGTTRMKSDVTGTDLETNSDLIGIFGNYYYPVSTTSTLELSGEITYVKTEAESVAAAPATGVTENETTSAEFELGAQYDMQIAEHFHFVPGVFFHVGTREVEDSEDDASGFQINLAKFRYVF